MSTPANQVMQFLLLMLALAGLLNSLIVQALTLGTELSTAEALRNSRSVFGLSGSMAASPDLSRTFKGARARVNEAFGKLPLRFEANRGQAAQEVKFISRGSGYSLLLSSTGATLILKPGPSSDVRLRDELPASIGNSSRGRSQIPDMQVGVLRMSLLGAKSPVRVVGLDELPGKSNYFIGDDPTRWRVNVPAYSKVKYEQVYPGIDLIYYGNQRQLEYDFSVSPGASPEAIRFSFEGSEKIHVEAGGDLAIETSAGEVRQHRPEVYQVRDGIKRQIAASYTVKGERVIGFAFGEYDSSLPLTIDPVLVYSTYLGGSGADQARAIAVDSDGDAYVTGFTLSSSFPTVHPLQPGRSVQFPRSDVFVAKLNTSGNALVYSTYLGGDSDDQGNSIAVDSSGSVYVTGETGGTFPITPKAFQTDQAGGYDAFVTKLSPAGDALVYSTYLGGGLSPPTVFNPTSGTDIGYGIAVDSQGNAYVTGATYSPSFPTKRAIQSIINRGSGAASSPPPISIPPPPPPLFHDAFVTKVNPSGSAIVYSTYLGGFKDDEGRGIAVDSAGSVYVAGTTSSSNFPTAQALQPGYAGDPGDAFLVRLDPSGRAFVFSTFLGGSGDDEAYGVAIDSAGNAYITGETASINFPTTSNAFQTATGGSPIFKSTDGGNTWNAASAGLPDNSFRALAVDPKTPTTLYAGMGDLSGPGGAFKSTDGGGHWFGINNGLFAPQTSSVSFLTIDPKTPTTLYALSLGAIFKSTNGGNGWSIAPMTMPGFSPLSLAVDPATPTTIYAGTNTCPPPPSPLPVDDAASFNAPSSVQESGSSVHQEEFLQRAVFKSIDGGVTWSPTALSICTVASLAIDPKSSSTIYTTTFFTIYKSTDGGNSWSSTSNPAGVLAIDPTNSATIYAAISSISSNTSGKVTKSTDGGATWSDTGLTGVSIKAIAVDPMNPNTIYAGANNLTVAFDYFSSSITTTGFGGGVFKSTDGGNTWSGPTLVGATIQALVIDPLSPSTLYAGAFRDSDAFVTKINATGSALIYSSLLGGPGRDAGLAIAVDSKGRAYIAGETLSGSFPIRDAIQASKASGLFATGAFVGVFDAAGDALVYSTHLGGSGDSNNGDAGTGIAVDAFGKAYVAGHTASKNFPTRAAIQPAYGGSVDVFVSKFAFPPTIANVSITGKNLSVTGDNFDKGAVILINGEEQTTRNDESRPATVLTAKKAAKNIAPRQRVTIHVRNADGILSEAFNYTRP